MTHTDRKFWLAERERLTERQAALAVEAEGLHQRLTDITKEAAMLDDVLRRLAAHLPDESTKPDALQITNNRGAAA
jgi:predicted nuclease with TOPRIM domain